jgi:hypothetical protein
VWSVPKTAATTDAKLADSSAATVADVMDEKTVAEMAAEMALTTGFH